MQRDATQSLLDEKFPKGVNVYIAAADVAFNTARLMVIDDYHISCAPHDLDREVSLYPKDVVEKDDGTVVLTDAASGGDVVLRPAPDMPELVEQRLTNYTDRLLSQLRGEVT